MLFLNDDFGGILCLPAKKSCIFFAIYMALLVACNICHIVAYFRVTRNDLTGNNCSDTIINEIMRKGFEDITTNIRYIKINFISDLSLFLVNFLAMIIELILDKFKILVPKDKNMDKENDDDEEKNEELQAEIPLSTYYNSNNN